MIPPRPLLGKEGSLLLRLLFVAIWGIIGGRVSGGAAARGAGGWGMENTLIFHANQIESEGEFHVSIGICV